MHVESFTTGSIIPSAASAAVNAIDPIANPFIVSIMFSISNPPYLALANSIDSIAKRPHSRYPSGSALNMGVLFLTVLAFPLSLRISPQAPGDVAAEGVELR